MYEEKFSPWVKWEKRNELPGIKFPGIYVCAVSKENIENDKFAWISEIAYIGMTNSKLGLKGRLKQFDNTIVGKTGHGGADRFRYKYQDYTKLINSLYVSVSCFECKVSSERPLDLRVMGDVAKFEYDCFACFKDKYGQLPEFNEKKLSPKYSLTIGRGKRS